MRKKIFPWIGREFIALSGEGNPALTVTEQARDLFRRMGRELEEMGLSLENTVRSRLWGRERKSRDLASEERLKILSGVARSASSSYIAPGHFDSEASVAVDLLAMRPGRDGARKLLKEYDPPIVPLRYLVYDSVTFLSGVTAVLPTLAEQLADILPRISSSLADARSSWERAVRVSFYLHRSQRLENLKALFAKAIKPQIPQMEYAFVDGYSAEGKLVEIEVTATSMGSEGN